MAGGGPDDYPAHSWQTKPTLGPKVALHQSSCLIRVSLSPSRPEARSIYGIAKSKRKKVARTFIRGSLVLGLSYGTALGGSIAGRDIPVPLYGVTLDDVSTPT